MQRGSLGADPPGKRLHRDTFFYPNEQSAGLISALSRPMHATILSSA